MNDKAEGKVVAWVPIVLAILGFVAGGGWLQVYMTSQSEQKKENLKLISEYLAPINSRLEDNRALYDRIYEKHIVEGWGILESYVNRVNQSPHYAQLSLMTKDIAAMSTNNSEIVGLLTSYSGYALTEDFNIESAKFRKHANEWNNRWAAVPEVIKEGIQLPYAEPFPRTFPVIVKKEIEVRKKHL